MLQEAAFLDPRFKNLAFLSQDENTDTIERLKLKMLRTTSEEPVAHEDCDAESNEIDATESCTEMNELSASNQSQDSQPPKKKHKKDALTTLFEDMPTPAENSRFTSEDKIETELLKYSHEATISYDSNPLEWWKMKYDIYPNMSMQVKKIWSLPASSVKFSQQLAISLL